MKMYFLAFLCITFAVLGCARVRVEAPKEPIKVDISMRLDVYQHVAKDIDDIENIVSGSSTATSSSATQSMLRYVIEEALAQDLSPEVEAAALRRKDRRASLVSWEERGVIGESKSGLVELRDSAGADVSVNALINDENNDRMIIYQGIAKKNGTSVESVKELYAKKLQESASGGTPIEVLDVSSGKYEWKVR
ncbi:MAG: DUF1318 domain-containing protein [Candidatus Omnitrophica bacterium]|nr:DUF1318 domain-containing protein [Candidatus Omnitrophota bacterium]